MNMTPLDESPTADSATVLPYAGHAEEKLVFGRFRASTVSYGLTGIALFVAFNYVYSTYAIACAGYYRRNELVLLATWVVSGLALIDTGVGFAMAKGRSRPASQVRPLLICTLANLICLLTPTLWDLRVKYWPH